MGSLFGLAPPVLGAVYPERSDTDVIVLANPRVDFATRFELIKKAKSIDILTLSHTMDSDIGLPSALLLREAANRGVPIRMIFDGLASRMENSPDSGITGRGFLSKTFYDAPNEFTYLLADSSLKRPADIFWIDADWKWKNGFASDDFFHEKIMIFNRGLPDEAVIVGSRNIANSVLTGTDLAFILRPVHPEGNPQYAGRDLIAHFDGIWNLLARTKLPVTKEPLPTRLNQTLKTIPSDLLANHSALQPEFVQIQEALKLPAEPLDQLGPMQFRPKTSQVVSNEMMSQVLDQKLTKDFEERADLLKDDIIDLIVEKIHQARLINISTYAVSFPPKLESALVDALGRKSLVTIYTNGREAHSKNKDKGIGSTAMDLTLHNALNLGLTAKAEQEYRLYFLNYQNALLAAKRDPKAPYPWLHRKWISIDDWIAIGSHNFTQSASLKNSEIMVLFQDHALRRYTENLFEKNRGALYDRVSLEEIKAELENSPILDKVRRFALLDIVRELY